MWDTNERRPSSSSIWARRLAWFGLFLFILSGAAHRFALLETLPFFWLLGIVFVIALVALLSGIDGFRLFWEHGRRGASASLVAIFISCALLAPFVVGGYYTLVLPQLTEISTDLAEPPPMDTVARVRTRDMNAIAPMSEDRAYLQRQHYPRVSGRRYEARPALVMRAVDALAAARGWTPLSPRFAEVGEYEFLSEYYAPTFLLGIPADAAVRLTDEGETTYVDIRIGTRFAAHDLGNGARRIERFMADLDMEVARQMQLEFDAPAPALDEEEDTVE